MPQRTDTLDLARLRLTSGEGRRMELSMQLDPFEFSGEHYVAEPDTVPVILDLSKLVGGGHALRLRFSAALAGPCMRCLGPARPAFEVDAREVSQPGEGEELQSPYVSGPELDLRAWGRDALALALPVQLLCRAECAGLCPICGEDLNRAGAGHHHERAPDPRWAKLSELKLD